MRVLIIEDELIAAKRLESMILEIDPTFEVVSILDTISTSISWLSTNNSPDLIFLDIQLADGISFSIFEKINIETPIIFTTAYDQYAIQAFKLNSIDYLLKPISKQDLVDAVNKFKSSSMFSTTQTLDIKEFMNILSKESVQNFKERFVVKIGEHIKTVEVSDVKLFYSKEKATYAITMDNKQHIIDYTLDHVEELIDHKLFFRINRKYIIHINKIQDILTFSNSRLKITLHESRGFEDLIVARDKVKKFKSWLDR